MFCQNCGTALNDGEKFCYKCGAEQSHAAKFDSGERAAGNRPDESNTKWTPEVKKTAAETCLYTAILIAIIFLIYSAIKYLV